MPFTIVGTRNPIVARSRSAAARNAAGSQRGISTVVVPAAIAGTNHEPRPARWNIGVPSTAMSRGVSSNGSITTWAMTLREPCVASTPFGNPVVPPVNVTQNGSSGAMRGFGAASPTPAWKRSQPISPEASAPSGAPITTTVRRLGVRGRAARNAASRPASTNTASASTLLITCTRSSAV